MPEYVSATITHITTELRKVIVGQDGPIEQILVALLAEVWSLKTGNWGGMGAFALLGLIGVGIAARGGDRLRRGGKAS